MGGGGGKGSSQPTIPKEIAPFAQQSMGALGQLLSAFAPGMAGSAGTLFGPQTTQGFLGGLESLGRGASTGYLPDVMGAAEAQLVPSLNRAWERGAAGIREQAALTGTQTGSSPMRELTDLRTGLEANLGQQTAGILGSAVAPSIGAQAGSAQALAQLLPAIFGQAQGIFNMPAGLLGSISMAQPTGGAGKGQMGSALGGLAGSFFGPLGTAAGSALGNKLFGGP